MPLLAIIQQSQWVGTCSRSGWLVCGSSNAAWKPESRRI